MSARTAHARLLSLVLSFAFGVVGMSTDINGLAKSQHQKSELRRYAAGLGATVTVDTHNIFAVGVVVTVVCGLIALASILALAHALLFRFRLAKTSARARLHLRTVPLLGAHVLALLSLWLFAALIPFTDFVANDQAKITATLGGVQLSPAQVQAQESALGLTPVYHKLGYLRAGVILPWFAFLFGSTSAALSYVYARQAAAANAAAYAAQDEKKDAPAASA
ncbi:hypothetical protein WOLCODRAFT_28885 [Wolfiporia cocos MD-104 SS10]|uniref:Uncharacterized protein n=1 Tax=Wolfiporia cocos (strain MD-104) TaxID=742152 RepID=A0A2H3J5S9_WOLCO|nr:hypothetical protein WOLCODRAFT_28885 [Wolfiporia cocos MD-104 SS10]